MPCGSAAARSQPAWGTRDKQGKRAESNGAPLGVEPQQLAAKSAKTSDIAEKRGRRSTSCEARVRSSLIILKWLAALTAAEGDD